MAAREDDGRKHHIGIKQGEVGRYVLLPGDPDRVEVIASRFDNPKFLMRRREYTTWTGELDGVPVACTSTGIGCPSTAIAVEELADIGVDTFIRVGTSGSMPLSADGVPIGRRSRHHPRVARSGKGERLPLVRWHRAVEGLVLWPAQPRAHADRR
jgi:hypothetical protein